MGTVYYVLESGTVYPVPLEDVLVKLDYRRKLLIKVVVQILPSIASLPVGFLVQMLPATANLPARPHSKYLRLRRRFSCHSKDFLRKQRFLVHSKHLRRRQCLSVMSRAAIPWKLTAENVGAVISKLNLVRCADNWCPAETGSYYCSPNMDFCQ